MASQSPGLHLTYGTATGCELVLLSTTLNGKQDSEQEHVDYNRVLSERSRMAIVWHITVWITV